MIRYAITNRALFEGEERERRDALVRQAERLSRDGVDYFQVREKDLGGSELVNLLRQVLSAARSAGAMKVLANGAVDEAAEAGVDGVHLTEALAGAGVEVPERMIVSVACHTVEQIEAAVARRAQMVLFSPVFGKSIWGEEQIPGVGIDGLKAAVAAAAGRVPLLALGGVTNENAQACLDAGAAGVAGITMFLS